jgi:N-acetylneuraminate lyase
VAFIGGTTGESSSLTLDERLALAARWIEVARAPGLDVIVHAGGNCLADAQTIAAHAQRLGARAVAAVAPSYLKPTSVDALVGSMASIAAAAPDLPFYYYEIPSLTGLGPPPHRFLEAAIERIPNLAGIKFTFEAMGDFLAAQRVDGGRFDVLWGRDEMLLGALAMGAEGGVGSTYNAIAPLYLKLIEAFRRGDMATARDLQAQAIAFIDSLVVTGNFFAALKAVLRSQGVPITPAVRLPLAPVAEEKLAGFA